MIRRVLVVVWLAVLVAFAPSAAWAVDEPAPTTAEATSEPTATATAEPTTTAPASPAPTSSAAGTESDPVIVSLPTPWLAVLLLIGSLVVFLLAALLVTSWGS